MAQGCSHGSLMNKKIRGQLLDIKREFDPALRMELGDLVDVASMRGGASAIDQSVDLDADLAAGERWIEQFAPTHVTWGNHCIRLHELMFHPNAIIASAARAAWGRLTKAAAQAKAKTKLFDLENGWFEIGGVAWGHGYFHGEMALRDTAEYLGMPVVQADLHYAHEVQGRTRAYTKSFCVGTSADIPSMHYSRRRRATSRWSHGCVIGEVCRNESRLYLISCEPGGDLRMPFTI